MTPPLLGSAADVARLYDEWSRTYDDDYAQRPETAAEDALVVGWLDSVLTKGASVLDVGCGTGWLLDRHKWPRALYRGFDVSTGMVETAATKHAGYRFYVGDALDRWPDYPADWRAGSRRIAVSLWSVLNHLPASDLPLFYSRFAHTPGDLLITLTRTALAPGVVATGGHDELSDNVWTHSVDDLTSAASAAGLTVLDAKGFLYGAAPSPPTNAHYLWVTYARSR